MADHQDSPKRQKTSCLQCRNPQKKRAHTCEKGMNRGRGSQRGGRMNSRGGSSNRGGRGGSRGGSSRVGGSKRKRHKKDDHLDSEDEAYHSHNAAPTGSTEVTRRSSRASKSTVKYTFDSDEFDEEDSSDEEDEQGNKITKIEMQENPVESIMGKREAEDGTTEWFVKWKEKSYIHACWVREEVFEPYRDFRMNGKMTRLNNKIENNTDITSTINYDDEMTLFDQEFLVVDEIIGHDEEWVTIDETAAAAAAAAALELEHAKKATENKNAAIILEQEKEKEMPEHPQPPFIDSFLHPTYICPTCGYILEDITYHGVLYESSIPTYTQACPHCQKSYSYSDYNVVFRGQRLGITLNHKLFATSSLRSNLVCYIESIESILTEVQSDEDEQFYQDNAARASMKVSDLIVGIREMAHNEKNNKTSSSLSSTSTSSASSTSTTTDVKVKAIPYRELFVTSGVLQSDLVDAVRTWRRPIVIKMRIPEPMSIHKRKTTELATERSLVITRLEREIDRQIREMRNTDSSTSDGDDTISGNLSSSSSSADATKKNGEFCCPHIECGRTFTSEFGLDSHVDCSLEQQKLEELIKSQRIYAGFLANNQNIFIQPPNMTGGKEKLKLRDYQKLGAQWLENLFFNGLNGILADETGLGKTIQVIATIANLKHKGMTGCFLIVAPFTTLRNWEFEFERWCPGMNTLLYHGTKAEREELRTSRMGMTKSDKDGVSHIKDSNANYHSDQNFPIIVTSYDILIRDVANFRKFEWSCLVVDEVHRLKEKDCRLMRSLKSLRTYQRYLLTSTFDTSLSELWLLLNFLHPETFDDSAFFESCFRFFSVEDLKESMTSGGAESIDILDKLSHVLSPVLMRRLKTDVIKELPDKNEIIVMTEVPAPLLSPSQMIEAGGAALFSFLRQLDRRQEITTTEEDIAKAEIALDATINSTSFVMSIRKIGSDTVLFNSTLSANFDKTHNCLNFTVSKFETFIKNNNVGISFFDLHVEVYAVSFSLSTMVQLVDTVLLFSNDRPNMAPPNEFKWEKCVTVEESSSYDRWKKSYEGVVLDEMFENNFPFISNINIAKKSNDWILSYKITRYDMSDDIRPFYTDVTADILNSYLQSLLVSGSVSVSDDNLPRIVSSYSSAASASSSSSSTSSSISSSLSSGRKNTSIKLVQTSFESGSCGIELGGLSMVQGQGVMIMGFTAGGQARRKFSNVLKVGMKLMQVEKIDVEHLTFDEVIGFLSTATRPVELWWSFSYPH